MGKHKEDDKLDAFGHLSWTVGNEDWIACFDAIRKGGVIEYHVVVDCESAGFVDTLEMGSVPATEQGVRNLRCFPSYWADICQEHYSAEQDDERYQVSSEEVSKTEANWNAHLDRLVAEAAAMPLRPLPGEVEPEEGEADEVWWDEGTLKSWRP